MCLTLLVVYGCETWPINVKDTQRFGQEDGKENNDMVAVGEGGMLRDKSKRNNFEKIYVLKPCQGW